MESYRLRESAYGYSACGYLPCSLEKGSGSLYAACPTKAAGRWTPLCPCWVWYTDFNPPLIPLSERAQLWKSRPTDVRSLREWVCHTLSCLLHCSLCFFLPLSFTVFSREREHFCPELKLRMIHVVGLWDDRFKQQPGGALVLQCLAAVPVLTGDFAVFQAHFPCITHFLSVRFYCTACRSQASCDTTRSSSFPCSQVTAI